MRGCGLMRRDEVSGESAFVSCALARHSDLDRWWLVYPEHLHAHARKRSVSSGLFCLFLSQYLQCSQLICTNVALSQRPRLHYRLLTLCPAAY